MGDHVVSLTEEQEAGLEVERVGRAFVVILPDDPAGEPMPLPDPLTADEFVQAVVDRYLAGKKQARARVVLRDITPEEVQVITDLRAELRPSPEPI